MENVNELLTNEILACLTKCAVGGYTTDAGEALQGEAISALKESLTSSRPWRRHHTTTRFRGLGSLAEFETLCEQLGFRVVRARNRRNQRTIVVTL